MRILVVAMANSIHTVRWLQQFDGDTDKAILLFPSTYGGAKDEFSRWGKLISPLARFNPFKRGIVMHIPNRKLNSAFHLFAKFVLPKNWRAKWLIRTIKRYKPDIIHSLEFQSAGYICLEAKESMGKDFPTWIATNWGSDIYLYSQLKEHKQPIAGILEKADFYSAECARDYDLAKSIGLKAKELPVIPNAGGFHLEEFEKLRKRVPTSQRKVLFVKGYQQIFGRALTALRAIELVADKLKNIKICICPATIEVVVAGEIFANKTGLDVEIIPIDNYQTHEKMLELHASARAYVGMSISDGISTSMLEAMAAGAFPIQTCTSCASEWVEDGVSGFIAPCEDERTLGDMIVRAMTDDALVDKAAEINWATMQKKAAYGDVQKIARGFYDTAYTYSRYKKTP